MDAEKPAEINRPAMPNHMQKGQKCIPPIEHCLLFLPFDEVCQEFCSAGGVMDQTNCIICKVKS
jgi:hypothetical protein